MLRSKTLDLDLDLEGINWIQGLAERVNSAWELGLMQDSGHLPVLTWSAALKEVTQDQIIQMRPKSISWPTDLEEEVPEDLDDIMAGMEARDVEDADVVVEYERDITTNQSGTVTFGASLKIVLPLGTLILAVSLIIIMCLLSHFQRKQNLLPRWPAK